VTLSGDRIAAKSNAYGGFGRHDLCTTGSWRRISYIAVGGLTEVGFGQPARFLLIVSHQGRGVVDCVSGVRVARDPDEGPGWFDESVPAAEGIGPLSGQRVPVAGLAGGSLGWATTDGWRVSVGTNGAVVHAPDDQDSRLSFTIEEPDELRAWGFSPDGLTVLAAASPGLAIYHRDHLD
jgi:hypothetical protein